MSEERVMEYVKKNAEKRGYKLNPNEEILMTVVKGLANNWSKYGKPFCPCRLEKVVCPCKYLEDEIKEMGHCHCQLFIKGEE
jgi:ferredoxin-thioredoxin reductase catalytic subunit